MYHALGVCWIIFLPLHYRSNIKTIKLIHVASIMLALVVPAIPVVAQLAAGGYRPYASPPRFCTGRNVRLTYYTFLLPAAVIFAVIMYAMILVFGVILKVWLLPIYNYYFYEVTCIFNVGNAFNNVMVYNFSESSDKLQGML